MGLGEKHHPVREAGKDVADGGRSPETGAGLRKQGLGALPEGLPRRTLPLSPLPHPTNPATSAQPHPTLWPVGHLDTAAQCPPLGAHASQLLRDVGVPAEQGGGTGRQRHTSHQQAGAARCSEAKRASGDRGDRGCRVAGWQEQQAPLSRARPAGRCACVWRAGGSKWPGPHEDGASGEATRRAG